MTTTDVPRRGPVAPGGQNHLPDENRLRLPKWNLVVSERVGSSPLLLPLLLLSVPSSRSRCEKCHFLSSWETSVEKVLCNFDYPTVQFVEESRENGQLPPLYLLTSWAASPAPSMGQTASLYVVCLSTWSNGTFSNLTCLFRGCFICPIIFGHPEAPLGLAPSPHDPPRDSSVERGASPLSGEARCPWRGWRSSASHHVA